MSTIRITTLEPAHFASLAQLQRDCYPTLGEQELMNEAHFAGQYDVFAEGQIVALDGDRVVGQGSGFFTDFDFERPNHTFREICAGFYFTNHDPAGGYYYGADISVHPDWRGRGIGKRIYAARKAVVRRHDKRGIVAGGLLPGYAACKQEMSVHAYVDKVIAGELYDPTLSFQLRMGFRVHSLLQDYLEDSASDNWSTLIVWDAQAG
ncbi:MAG: GNAT family N-acetyltransferase [Caldilineaceae bacterium]|nr:GNAT family N-acetyltransferase [Caldilineaceae bacterium]